MRSAKTNKVAKSILPVLYDRDGTPIGLSGTAGRQVFFRALAASTEAYADQLVDHATEHADGGVLVDGEWMHVPSIFRLQMTGTGTVTLDSKDALGNITLSVYTVTLLAATNEIGFPYAGKAAISIRATLTGTATAKVI